MSTFCLSVVLEVLPLTRKAKILTRPSVPLVNPGQGHDVARGVPVFAHTLPTAHFDAVVVKRLASVPVRPAVGSRADFSGHSLAL